MLESTLKCNTILSELLITLLLYASIDFNPLHSQEAQAGIPLQLTLVFTQRKLMNETQKPNMLTILSILPQR